MSELREAVRMAIHAVGETSYRQANDSMREALVQWIGEHDHPSDGVINVAWERIRAAVGAADIDGSGPLHRDELLAAADENTRKKPR